MRQHVTVMLMLLQLGVLHAQNMYDNNWVFPNLNLGSNILSFDGDSLKISALGTAAGRAREALACMSDKNGNLLFYTNNCTVFNRNHQIMENGEGLNPGQIQTYWCSANPFANPNDNSVIILPQPSNEQLFQIFHWDFEAFNISQPGGTQFAPLHLYHTVVDLSKNNSLGIVVSKNNLIIADTLNSCALQAVRHANGRDWWIIVPEFNGNCYYKVLLDPFAPQVVDKQCIGSDWGKYGGGSAHFTNNSSRYVRCDIEYGLNLFDFNRCTGQLSNPVHVPIGPQGAFLLNSMTLSPSGRFAYYHTRKDVYQYDLESQDIAASKTLIATYDGFVSVNQTDFYKSQLAPDGKIYINSFGPVYWLHVIEHPDSAGLACRVRQHAIELPNYHFASMPNYPNYRLGALPGPCDTINTSATELETAQTALSITPNPSTGDFQVKSTENEVLTRIEIIDLAGKIVHAFQCDNTLVTLRREQHQLGRGFYLIRATGKRGHQYVSKIILE